MRQYQVQAYESVTGVEFHITVKDDGDGLRKTWRVERGYHVNLPWDHREEDAPAVLRDLAARVEAVSEFFRDL